MKDPWGLRSNQPGVSLLKEDWHLGVMELRQMASVPAMAQRVPELGELEPMNSEVLPNTGIFWPHC